MWGACERVLQTYEGGLDVESRHEGVDHGGVGELDVVGRAAHFDTEEDGWEAIPSMSVGQRYPGVIGSRDIILA